MSGAADLPITVTLGRALSCDGEEITALAMDEPDLDAQIAFMDLQAKFSNPPSERDAMLSTRFWIARCAGISEAAAGKIKGTDLDRVNAALKVALGEGAVEDAGNAPAA